MPYSIDPQRFAQRMGSWLQAEGPEADVVVSCRVRLARNVDGYPFILRLDDTQARELSEKLREVLSDQRLDGETVWIGMEEASPILRLLLREGGPNLLEMPESELRTRACRHGWSFACAQVAASASN